MSFAVTPLADPRIGELITGVLIAVLGAIGALAGWIQRKFSKLDQKADENADQLTRVNRQVTNDHGTNLRDDLDTMRDEIRDGFKRMDHLFGEVHDRLEQEAKERHMLDARATDEHRRMWKVIDSRK